MVREPAPSPGRGPVAIDPVRVSARRAARMGQYAHPFREPRLDVGPPPANRAAPDLDRRRKLAGAAQGQTVVGDRPVAARRWHGRIMAAVGSNGGGVRVGAASCFGIQPRLDRALAATEGGDHAPKKTWHPPRVTASGGDY